IPLDERIPGKTFPPGLGDVIAKALAKEPDERWASAAEFGEALRPFGPTTPASVAALPVSTPTPSQVAPSAPASSGAAPEAAPSAGEPAALVQPAVAAPRIDDAPTEGEGQLSSRTLVIVSAVSVVAGIVLAILALRLLD